MSSILIYHHLGLGDHIMCHGIVREYCKRYDRVTIFAKAHNYSSVAFMYRDLQNLTVIKGDDAQARVRIFLNNCFGNLKYNKVLTVGFDNLDATSGIQIEQQFYAIAEVPLEKKWESFLVKRDLDREHSLIRQIAPIGDFVFLHEDPSRNFVIKRTYVGKDYYVITPNKQLTDNIFDYCRTIEKAKEIHVIDSSFMFLIDCLPYKNPEQKRFVHRYSRQNPEWQLPILKKSWTIITE
ncbi:MAG: hypothetical protein WCO79_02685 [bacterium]